MCTIIFSLSPKYILFQLSTNIFPVGPTFRYIIRLDNNAYNYTEARSSTICIDRVEEGLQTEMIHVMFYNEVWLCMGPSLYLFITPAKVQELIVSNVYIAELPHHMPLETKKIEASRC